MPSFQLPPGNTSFAQLMLSQGSCHIRWFPKRDDTGCSRWQEEQRDRDFVVEQACPVCKSMNTRDMYGSIGRAIYECRRCHRDHVHCKDCGSLFCLSTQCAWTNPLDERMSPACHCCPEVIERGRHDDFVIKHLCRHEQCARCHRYHIVCEECDRFVCYNLLSEDTSWQARIFFPFECVDAVREVNGIINVQGALRVKSTDRVFPLQHTGTQIQVGYAIATDEAFCYLAEAWDECGEEITPATFTFKDECGEEAKPFLPDLINIEYPEWQIEVARHPREAASCYKSKLASAALNVHVKHIHTELREALQLAVEYVQMHTNILRWAKPVKELIAFIQRQNVLLDVVMIDENEVVSLTASIISATLSLPNELFNPILFRTMVRLREAVARQAGRVNRHALFLVGWICKASLMIHCDGSFNSYGNNAMRGRLVVPHNLDDNEDDTQFYTDFYIDGRQSLLDDLCDLDHTAWASPSVSYKSKHVVLVTKAVRNIFDVFQQAINAIIPAPSGHVIEGLLFLKMKPFLSTARHIVPIGPGIHHWVVHDMPFDDSFYDESAPVLLSDEFWQVLLRDDTVAATRSELSYSRTIPSYVSYQAGNSFILKHHSRAGSWMSL